MSTKVEPAQSSMSVGSEADYPKAAYAWFVVLALAFANMMGYVERQILSLLFDPIKSDFLLNDTEVSLLSGAAFGIFYVCFGLVVGRFADSANRKWIITIGIFCWSTATIFSGLSQNFTELFIARVCVGVGEATLGTCALSMLSDYFPRIQLARALSVYSGAQYLGAGLAVIVGGFAMHFYQGVPPPVIPFIGTLVPWQMTLFSVGVFGLVVAVPMFFVKEPVRRGLLLKSGVTANKGVPFPEFWAFMKANGRTFGCIFAAFSITGIVGFATATWMPTYFIRVFHWDRATVGLTYGTILAVCGLLGVLSGAQVLHWMERRGYRDAYLRLPLFIVPINGALQISTYFIRDQYVAISLVALFTYLGTFPLSGTLGSMQVITPNQMRGQVTAVFLFTANILGTGLGPTIVGALNDFVYRDPNYVGYSLATTVAIVAPVATLLIYLSLRPFRESLDRAQAWANVTAKSP